MTAHTAGVMATYSNDPTVEAFDYPPIQAHRFSVEAYQSGIQVHYLEAAV